MQMSSVSTRVSAVILILTVCACASAPRPAPPRQTSTVVYGLITAVNPTTINNEAAQAGGALIGGTLGMISGSGQSSSNRALRGIGGAFAGQQLARAVSNQPAFQYTILLNGRSTITVVSDGAGLRVGDCVSVERGQFNNMRLEPDERCAANAVTAAPLPADVREANACDAAKNELLATTDDAAFNLAERRVRLLCNN